MQNRLVVDITYLAHWRGKLTGVPRCIQEITSRYAETKDTIFVVWDSAASSFFEVDVEATLKKHGQAIFYLEKSHSSTSKKMYSAVGFSLRASKKLNRNSLPVPNKLISAQQRLYEKKLVKHHPKNGDVFIICFGEWTDSSYIQNVKKQAGLGVKIIQVCYDMLPVLMPQYSGHSTIPMTNYNREIFPICTLILTISENTKKDIIKWLKSQNLYTPQIGVFRLGDDYKSSAKKQPKSDDFASSKLTGDDFVLCVGTIEARKNHTLLYYVYKLAASKGIKLPKIVIVGRKGWNTENIVDMITSDGDTKDKFVLMLNSSDEELSWLYEKCLFTIYPSFYEGWGLPIAESIANGVPCISSNTSSMQEIAGNLLQYFNPASSDECLGLINKMLDPKELDNAKKLIKNYKPTTWQQTFTQVDDYVRGVQ